MTSCSVMQKDNKLSLWYRAPADASVVENVHYYNGWNEDKEWLKALPVGNGSLGASVYGDVHKELVQLDEKTMWSGSPQDSDNPLAANYLEQIRALLFEGKYKEASELTDKTQICKGAGSGDVAGSGYSCPFGCYQMLGNLWVDFENKKPYTDYYRELDLSDAVAKVSYRQDGVSYTREVFVSAPDQVMVVKLSASKKKQLSFTCKLNRPERFSTHAENGQLIMTGALSEGKGGDGLRYLARLKAVTANGEVVYSDSSVTVKGADEAVLLLTASTDYKLQYPTYKGRDFSALTEMWLERTACKSYKQLLEAHIKDYSSYFNRVSFNLNDSLRTVPTDSMVINASRGNVNPHLYELMFQYGRYLLISSSRPGSMPANLQGIWANELCTPWNGDYHTDVNVEMNYWPAEVTNLSEMHLPLFDLISSLVQPGTKTASIQYHKKGWVVHPITNVWGYTSPGQSASWGMHTAAAAWICQHIGEHYRFTGDKEFLKRMYPVLKGAVEFYLDWLTVNPKNGMLVSGPAVSPENTFIAPDGSHCQISMGPTHDQQTINQLFADFLMASEALQIDDSFSKRVAEAKSKLAGTKIGHDGRIMEWPEEFKEVEPGHRHISHLFAVYPGSQINLIQTPELAEAANKSIDFRIKNGGGFNGWSSAWLISQYARLHRAEDAKESLDKLIEKRINPNLFTECPPFQIDANFGTTAGIAEMLLQSQVYEDGANIIELLPALPKSWTDGEISGLKARGGFEIDIKWKNGHIVKARVKSLLGNNYKILYNNVYLPIKKLRKGEAWEWSNDNKI